MTNNDLLNMKLTVHEVEARIGRVEKVQQDIMERLDVLEAFFKNIKKITTDYQGE